MEYDFLLENCIRGKESKYWDLLVNAGKIAALAPSGSLELPADFPRFDAGGKLLFPSFIDAHVHFREPGFEYKEDIASGLNAALHGGFGAVMPMANTRPINDTASVTRFMLEKARLAHPRGPVLHPVGALTLNLEGKELSPMNELREAGAVAVSNDGKPVQDGDLFRHAMEYAADCGLKIIDHCEDAHIAAGWQMNEGRASVSMGLKGQPQSGEAVQVARDVLLAEYLGLPVHLAHISCRQSVELIRWAKARGTRVTAETCPHYLFLDDSMFPDYNSSFKVSPPLRGLEDIAALRAALSEGVIDILATDHAPHAGYEKEVPFDEAPCGIIGLETAVSVTYELVRRKEISPEHFENLWCACPARIFHLPVNRFKPGDAADFFLFDPEKVWTVSSDALHSKSHNSPWLHRELRGKITDHWLSGRKLV
jgi:dihydroorotase